LPAPSSTRAPGGPTGRSGSPSSTTKRFPARDPAKGKFKALEDAPGSFVKFRLDAPKLESGAWLALTNDACFGEFRRVLAYPMFKLDAAAQCAALAGYDACVTRHMAPAAKDIVALPRCRDRDDQKFLELARDTGADWLVSADKDLLRLARRDKLRGLFRIVSPEAALLEV
jgi:predicted nucleic acid-binding protein